MCDNDSTINTDCQDIPVEWPVYDRYTDEPICTPLTDLMEAESDAAAMDAELMPFSIWIENVPAYELNAA